MLIFPKEFYQSETRNDFFIDSTMKTVWAAELEVLAAVAAVCEKYQLQWFADWGTLLGAVRHNGFIPWDDDIDICMKRPDYQKLMEVLPKELPKGWFVYNAMCGNKQEQFWSCVLNSDSISIEKERLEKFHGCPFIVGVDIFPLDYLPRNQSDAKMEEAVFNLIWKTVQLAKKNDKNKKDEKDIRNAVKRIEEICNVKISRAEDLVTQLWRLANELCMSYGEAESDKLVGYLFYARNKRVCFDKHWYDDVEYLPFENVELPVPIAYDEVLKVQYGDYMVFKQNGSAHDYPFYNKQLEQLRNIVKEMEEKAKQGG